jgi:hypothetical protein
LNGIVGIDRHAGGYAGQAHGDGERREGRMNGLDQRLEAGERDLELVVGCERRRETKVARAVGCGGGDDGAVWTVEFDAGVGNDCAGGILDLAGERGAGGQRRGGIRSFLGRCRALR